MKDGDTIDKEDRTFDRCGVIYCDASTESTKKIVMKANARSVPV